MQNGSGGAAVVLYTQDGCPESPRVRDWLRSHGVPFTERNLSTAPEYASELAATGTFATPLVVRGSTNVLGFRPSALSALFGDGRSESVN